MRKAMLFKCRTANIPMLLTFMLFLLLFVNQTSFAETILVSVDSDGNGANNSSNASAISADGRYVAFVSDANNLVEEDTNVASDIFVHDTQTGTTTRASVDSAGNDADFPSYEPAISAYGRYVAFVSDAENLVAGDDNKTSDIFVRDTQTGTTTRVSVDSDGNEANNSSNAPVISAYGRYVAFVSDANNLVEEDTNVASDIFVHDTQTGTTTRVSVDSAGNDADFPSYEPAISADGRYVAFVSDAYNFVANDTKGVSDVFVHKFLADDDGGDNGDGSSSSSSSSGGGFPGSRTGGGGGGGCFIYSVF